MHIYTQTERRADCQMSALTHATYVRHTHTPPCVPYDTHTAMCHLRHTHRHVSPTSHTPPCVTYVTHTAMCHLYVTHTTMCHLYGTHTTMCHLQHTHRHVSSVRHTHRHVSSVRHTHHHVSPVRHTHRHVSPTTPPPHLYVTHTASPCALHLMGSRPSLHGTTISYTSTLYSHMPHPLTPPQAPPTPLI